MAVANVGLIVHDTAGVLRYVNARFFSEHFMGLIQQVPAIERRVRSRAATGRSSRTSSAATRSTSSCA
jgi:hypothetical protein